MTTHPSRESRQGIHKGPLSVSILVWGLRGGALANMGASLAHGFKTIGVDTELLVVHPPSGKEGARYANVPFCSLGSRRSATSVPALARHLRRTRPDVLLAQSAIHNIVAIVAAGVARTGTPVIVTEHTDLSVATARSSAANARMRVLPPLVRLLYPRARGLVSVSSRALADPIIAPLLVRLPHAVIRNPFTWDLAARANEGPPHRWLRPMNNRAFTFVAAGRLVDGKGFPLLIRALARLRRRGVDARVIILGEGEQRTSLEQLRSEVGVVDSVDMPGFTRNPYPTIAAADAFVLSSGLEGSSMALLEAMALGRPIVATAAGGTTEEVLKDRESGLVVPDGDVDALAEALGLIATRPVLARALGRAACCASEDRRPDRVAQRYVDFFTTVLARDSGVLHNA
jgi:glycosyltransferase involved in cell wall biosynthesis